MAFCTECGAKLLDDAQFCTSCGTKRSTYIIDSDPIPVAAIDDTVSEDAEASAEQVREPVMAGAAEKQQGTYYTPPTPGGFVPPYQPGKYSFAPQPQVTSVPKKSGSGKTALIVILSLVFLAVVALVLITVLGNPSPAKTIVGYWESDEMDFGTGSFVDEYYGYEVEGMMGLQVNSSGSMYIGSAFNSEIIEGSWTAASGKISATLNGQQVSVSLRGDELLLQDGKTAILFERASGDINSPSIPFGSYSGGESAPILPAQPQEAPLPSPGASVAGSGDVSGGLYNISVVGAEKTRDYDGKPVVRFYYEFTNSFDYPVAAWDVLDFEARQDGNALNSAYTWGEDVPEYYNCNLSVRPGVTILCTSEFYMEPDGGSIDFTIFGWNEGKEGGFVTASYSPDALPGRPSAYVIAPVESPNWTLSIPAAGTLDDVFYVEVKDAKLVTDSDGDAAIRVFYSFKNGSDEPASLTGALYCRSYQDGVQLNESYASGSSDTDDMAYKEISAGETANCSIVYKLRSTTAPVEAEVEASLTYDAVGQTYPIA